MPRISFVFRTDTHVSDTSPASWKGDYPEEIWSNLEQVGQFAKEREATAVLDGGDYFHVKAASRNSHASIYRTVGIHQKYPCPTFCVEGNHDLAYNNLDSIKKQPLGVLYASGVFQHLREQVFVDGGLQVRVVGVPYQPNRTLEELRAIQKKPGDAFLVAVVHALASENPPAQVEDFFGEPVFKYADLVTEDGPDVWCFPPDTPVLDWLYRPIPIDRIGESIAVLGRSGATVVETVHPVRQVSEPLVHLDIEGVPPLVPGATEEHPYRVEKGLRCVLPSRSSRRCHPDKPRNSHPCSSCERAPVVQASWVQAGEIQAGDFVALPVPVIPDNAPSSPGLARLLGYYAAEGHLLMNRGGEPVAGVAWSFHEEELGLHEDVRKLVLEHFGLKTYSRPGGQGKCTQVCAYGREVAEFFGAHGGRYSSEKELSSWLWQRSAEDRLEFLIGWLSGDGHARSEKTDVMGATASQVLAYQIFFIALSVGLRPFFTVRPPRTHQNYPAHVVSFYGDDGEALSVRLGVSPPERNKTKVGGFFADGLYYSRVREVCRFDYEGPVHNFRTTSGEYVAGGVLVHNCFGHWHRDQGVVQLGGKTFINQGALSRGALSHENITRTPQVSLIEFEKDVSFELLPLIVAPPEDVFDFDRKERVESEKRSVDAFVQRLQEDVDLDPARSIEDNIGDLGFAKEVRDLALFYLEQAREVG